MTLPKHHKTLLVIVTEAVLEKPLVRDAKARGAQGWTVCDVRGGGRSGEREGAWEADRSIELKIICDTDVADRIAEHVLATYAPHYGLSMTFASVSVLRPDRY